MSSLYTLCVKYLLEDVIPPACFCMPTQVPSRACITFIKESMHALFTALGSALEDMRMVTTNIFNCGNGGKKCIDRCVPVAFQLFCEHIQISIPLTSMTVPTQLSFGCFTLNFIVLIDVIRVICMVCIAGQVHSALVVSSRAWQRVCFSAGVIDGRLS